MAYQPNSSDALGAYLAVAAHLGVLPLPTLDPPGLADIEMTGWDEFVISDSSARDHHNTLIVVCTYLADEALWAVQLPTGEALGVRVMGGEFAVVEG